MKLGEREPAMPVELESLYDWSRPCHHCGGHREMVKAYDHRYPDIPHWRCTTCGCVWAASAEWMHKGDTCRWAS